MKKSIQELVAPDHVCFGCGPANAHGLHIRSIPDEDGVHVNASMLPDDKYCGWPGLAYGGYLAMLCDCHSNWTAIYAHYCAEGREPGAGPEISCVTGTLSIRYIKPTPMGVELRLKARVDGEIGRKTRVICEVWAGEECTVVSEAILVRVDPAALAKKAHGERE